MANINYAPKYLITEDDVEKKFVEKLFTKELGYDSNSDLKWKESIAYKLGREKFRKEADLVVYKNNNPVLVVESKRPTESVNEALAQTDSYASAKEVRYSLITNGRQLILREYLAGNKKINIISTTIDKLHTKDYLSLINIISKNNIDIDIKDYINTKDIKSNEIKDYRRFFRSIHNIIRDNEKLDPTSSFDEFSKILYLKIASEQYIKDKDEDNYFKIENFKNVPKQDPMGLINKYFQDAMQHYYNSIFEESLEFNIKLITLETIWKKLDNFHIQDDKMDIKGRAFEEFLPSQLRGKGLGQFFTPRTIVDFMVDMAEIDMNDIVADFACGSGGFLIKSFDKMKTILNTLPESTFKSIGTTKKDFEEDMKKNQIFGIDAEPRAVKVAKMNMMLWGDGKQVVRGNGLDKIDWDKKPYNLNEYDKSIDDSGCTLVLANPPFIKEKNTDILSQYTLAEGKKSVDAQILFIEKGLKLLRPFGKMLIVLPEGILSNENTLNVREYILKNAKIKAIIELPTHTFVQSGVDTINTVVLYLEKYEDSLKNTIEKQLTDNTKQNINIIKNMEDIKKSKIFMASVENVGFEPNGRIFYNNIDNPTKNDLDIVLDKFLDSNKKIEEIDILNKTLEDYETNNKKLRGQESYHDIVEITLENIDLRLDPSFYLFKKNIGDSFNDFIPLSNYGINVYRNKLELKTEDDLDKEYILCSVNKNNPNSLLEFKTYKSGDELSTETTKKLIVKNNSIVYNPYRANIGSFSIVPKELDSSLVSGAYVNFSVDNFDSLLLLHLFKTPIYNKYINILTTGSVRDNFSESYLNNILVPNLNSEQQKTLLKELQTQDKKLFKKTKEIQKIKISKIQDLYNIFDFNTSQIDNKS